MLYNRLPCFSQKPIYLDQLNYYSFGRIYIHFYICVQIIQSFSPFPYTLSYLKSSAISMRYAVGWKRPRSVFFIFPFRPPTCSKTAICNCTLAMLAVWICNYVYNLHKARAHTHRDIITKKTPSFNIIKMNPIPIPTATPIKIIHLRRVLKSCTSLEDLIFSKRIPTDLVELY